jgi:hypothetical protein
MSYLASVRGYILAKKCLKLQNKFYGRESHESTAIDNTLFLLLKSFGYPKDNSFVIVVVSVISGIIFVPTFYLRKNLLCAIAVLPYCASN